MIAVVSIAVPASGRTALEEGDRAWSDRAESVEELDAAPARTEEAIGAYREACELAPDALEPCWKLLRALHFLVEFTSATEARKDQAAERAVELAGQWSDELGEADADASADRAQLCFWSAIAWGARGRRVGLLTIVREGLAGRIRDEAQCAVRVDPTIERGGPYRLLSRLHSTLPRVPFVTGWVDRGRALPLAEKAMDVAPEDPGNQLLLALTLLDHGPEDRRSEAKALLEQVAGVEPRASLRVEDLTIRHEARQRLAELEGSGSGD